tara:strand:+ start:319 stop:624 length:306 start_codon:yes stop_codon:yes gene_type:complete
MSKKEKYIKFIVDDLVNETIIDEVLSAEMGMEFIVYPFKKKGKGWGDKHNDPIMAAGMSTRSWLFKENFMEHVQNRYGVSENEIETLLEMYREGVMEKFSR